MRRSTSARKKGAKKAPSPVILDRRRVSPADSEDEAGTYAPRKSEDDTGESDDGVLGHVRETTPAKETRHET